MPTKTKARTKKTVVNPLETPGKGKKTTFTTIEDVLLRKNAPIEQKRMAHELISAVGGEKGLAEKILAEYNMTAPGSPARAKFFDLVLKIIRMGAPKEVMGDLEHISEQDIVNVLREQVAVTGVQLGYPDHVCI